MPPKIARLAGLGAFAACTGFAVLFALFVFITRPTASSGLDATQRFLSCFTVAGVLVAVLLVHVMFGRQLIAVSKGESRPV